MPDAIYEKWKNEGARSYDIFTCLIETGEIKVKPYILATITPAIVEEELKRGNDLVPQVVTTDEKVNGAYEMRDELTGFYVWKNEIAQKESAR